MMLSYIYIIYILSLSLPGTQRFPIAIAMLDCRSVGFGIPGASELARFVLKCLCPVGATRVTQFFLQIGGETLDNTV